MVNNLQSGQVRMQPQQLLSPSVKGSKAKSGCVACFAAHSADAEVHVFQNLCRCCYWKMSAFTSRRRRTTQSLQKRYSSLSLIIHIATQLCAKSLGSTIWHIASHPPFPPTTMVKIKGRKLGFTITLRRNSLHASPRQKSQYYVTFIQHVSNMHLYVLFVSSSNCCLGAVGISG